MVQHLFLFLYHWEMVQKKEDFQNENPLCGERGIRTLGTVTRTLPFQGSSFNHSDTSPVSLSLRSANVRIL